MQDNREKIGMRIANLLAGLSTADKVLKGSVNKVLLGERKKGKGKRKSLLLTYKGKGNKTRTVYVSSDRLAEVKRMTANYRRAKQALEEIVELNVRLFKMK